MAYCKQNEDSHHSSHRLPPAPHILPHEAAWSILHEDKLRADLTSGYSPATRPHATTSVMVNLYVVSINEVDIKEESWSVVGWWDLEWNDTSRLTWNPADYGGISEILMLPADIWYPALFVPNSNGDLDLLGNAGYGGGGHASLPLRVSSTGRVIWRPTGVYDMACDMVVTYFPFDVQQCTVELMEAGYVKDELELKVKNNVNFDFYQVSDEWSVISAWSEATEQDDDSLELSKAVFHISTRRRSEAYWLSIVIPVLLTAVLIPNVFLLPVASGEKMGYVLTTLLAFFILLTMVQDYLPSSSTSTSLFEVSIMIILSMSVVSVFLTCISVRWFEKPETEEPPKWLVGVARCIQTLCCQGNCQGGRSDDTVSGRELHKVDQTMDPIPEYPQCLNLPVAGYCADGVAVDKQKSKPEGEEDMTLTYKQLSEIIDDFFFRVYFILNVVLSVGFLVVLITGHP